MTYSIFHLRNLPSVPFQLRNDSKLNLSLGSMMLQSWWTKFWRPRKLTLMKITTLQMTMMTKARTRYLCLPNNWYYWCMIIFFKSNVFDFIKFAKNKLHKFFDYLIKLINSFGIFEIHWFWDTSFLIN